MKKFNTEDTEKAQSSQREQGILLFLFLSEPSVFPLCSLWLKILNHMVPGTYQEFRYG
jgi:hypothetical protein